VLYEFDVKKRASGEMPSFSKAGPMRRERARFFWKTPGIALAFLRVV